MQRSPSPSTPELTIAGRYSIRRKLGAGSSGAVYLVHDVQSAREVALKLLRTDRLSAGAIARLQNEFRLLAALRHPQIAAAHDFGYTQEGRAYYTREYIEGTPLPPGPPIDAEPTTFLQPIIDLLDALSYLHAHGIFHLDVHAGNLIVAKNLARGSVLIDFGLHGSGDASHASATRPLPEPPAPVSSSERRVETDLYLAGRALLYRLTGAIDEPVRLPREVPNWGPRLTLELERITTKALECASRHRFRSAGELRAALVAVLGDRSRAPGPSEPREVIVGRARELKLLDASLQLALAGSAPVTWVVSPRGLGKSKLLAEARLLAQLRGLEALAVSFRHEAAQSRPLLEHSLRSSLRQHAEGGWLDAISIEHGGAPAERAARAAGAYFNSTGKPLVLCLDDLDMADQESLLLARALVREALRPDRGPRSLCIIASSLKDPCEVLAGSVTGVRVAELRPLARRDALRLLRSLVAPLAVPRRLQEEVIAGAQGRPRRLRAHARSIRSAWGRRGSIPRDARISWGAALAPAGESPVLERAECRSIAEALAVLGRPAALDEICEAAGTGSAAVKSSLIELEEAEVAESFHRRGKRLIQLESASLAANLLRGLPEPRVRATRRRILESLERSGRRDVDAVEQMAFHKLHLGPASECRELVAGAAGLLRSAGAFARCLRLLELAVLQSGEALEQWTFVEEMSITLEESGDHAQGVKLLDRFRLACGGRLPPADELRFQRRLGIHCHRAGRADDALRILEVASNRPDATHDLAELILVDAEMAELCTLHGWYDRAQVACERGMRRLAGLGGSPRGFRERMDMTLRASLGHLELRRMRLDSAREHLEASASLARRHGSVTLRATVLNNLGIVENQRHDLAAARRAFKQVEKLLSRGGDESTLTETACNLSVVEAKLGNVAAARSEMERAADLVLRRPEQRLEFFVRYTTGLASGLLGEQGRAIEALESALPLGRKLGDLHHVRFGEAYLAEAYLFCGRYADALRILAASERNWNDAPAVLRRMVLCRRRMLEALLARPRACARRRGEIDKLPRSSLELVEAWNDLWDGWASSLLEDASDSKLRLERALDVFRTHGVPFGEGLARWALFLPQALSGECSLQSVEAAGKLAEPSRSHRFLAAAWPLALAEGHCRLGGLARARELLVEAGGAIVAAPFLELDGWLEQLWARWARKSGDLEAERRHLHRSLHTRDLLLQLVPARSRAAMRAAPRFRALAAAGPSRTHGDAFATPGSSRLKSNAGSYRGILGRSAPMSRLFRSIEQVARQDGCVLILGETGTGKELVARAIHDASPRARERFLAVHASTLPEEVFEAELFGYEQGAFTGAETTQIGLLESISGGTLLLDEVGELALSSQAKLLRALESSVIRRLGSAAVRPVDVRWIVSSRVPLRELIARERFRPDLYFRPARSEVCLPPLRERGDDLSLLAQHLLGLHSKRLDRPAPRLTPDGERLLASHDWPGNVRELDTLLFRALLDHSGDGPIDAPALKALLPPAAPCSRTFGGLDLLGTRLEDLQDELEAAYVRQLHERTGGDLKEMARRLQVKRSRLYVLLRKAGVAPKRR